MRKRMQRVLSLAAAAALVAGMLAVSAGAAYADFTDEKEIVHKEAVSAMVSLGVISGKEDGSRFDPNGAVTRAEMAKLIAVMLNGGKDPVVELGDTTAAFTDTKGTWAETYIAYCVEKGIIDGKGDGTFGPEEPVSSTAAAKMLLCALGYDSGLEGLAGAGWELKTDILANKIGLYAYLDDVVPAETLTRDAAARLLYNGLLAEEIKYEENEDESSGLLYARGQGTMLMNRFGVTRVTGVAVANDKKSVDASAYKTTKTGEGRVSVSALSGLAEVPAALKDNPVFPVSLSDDLLGQTIVILVKFADNAAPAVDGVAVVGGPIVVGSGEPA